jgi:hypothetical protein
MEMDEDTKAAIMEEVTPLIVSGVASTIVAGAVAILSELLVTNLEEDTPAGKVGLHPTKEATSMAGVDVAGAETEGKLAQDKVAAVNGEVKASETEARAATGEATAADSGASALRTKAGASDIETKGLKIT